MYNKNKHIYKVVIITSFLFLFQTILETLAQGEDQWRVMPIRTKEEYELGKIGGEGTQQMHGMARSLSNTNIIYTSQDCAGPWKSTDGGETWRKTLGKGYYIRGGWAIEVDPINPNMVFIVGSALWSDPEDFDGLYRSKDGGDNWELILHTNVNIPQADWRGHRCYTHTIAYDKASITNSGASVWYVAFDKNGLYKSIDYGDTWSQVADLASHEFIYSIYVHPDSGKVYIGSSEGLYLYSETNGLMSYGNLPAGRVTSIAINPQDSDLIYITLRSDEPANRGLYKSINGGTTFNLLKEFESGNSVHYPMVFMNPGYPDTLYLTGSASWPISPTIITHDGGQTWITTIKNQYNPQNEILVTPAPGKANPDRTYSLGGEIRALMPNPNDENEAVGFFNNGHFFKTTDGGYTWNDNSTLFTGYAIWLNSGFAFHKFNSNKFALFLCDVIMAMTNNAGDWFYTITNTKEGGTIHDWYTQGLVSSQGAHQALAGAFKPVPNSESMVATIGEYQTTAKIKLMYLEDESTGWELVSDIELIAAEHLDASRNLISNVYDNVKIRDDTWSEEIKNNEYLRVTFESNLTARNPIATYVDMIESAEIEVYKKDDDILLTTFGQDWAKLYSASLADLVGGENIFDLKIIGGPVKFDTLFEHKKDKITFIAFNPNDPNIVYAGNKISHDGGKSFEDVEFKNETETFNFNPWNPGIIDMSLSRPDTVYALVGWNKILRSDDRGQIWNLYATQGIGSPVLAVDPLDPNKIYSIGAAGDIAVYDGSAWTSLGLLPLVEKPAGMSIKVRNIVIDPNNSSIIYASVGGSGTTGLGSGIPVIWRSINAGETWEDISRNLPRIGSYTMAINPHTGELFVGGACGTWVLPPPYESSRLIYNKCIPVGPIDSNNVAPIFETIDDKSVDENQTLTFTVTATDLDGDPITYSIWDIPEGATFADQTFTWTPVDGQVGTYNVTFIASDGKTQTTQTIIITVNAINQAPKISPIEDKSVDENSLLSFTVDAVDLDDDSLTFTVEGLPSGAVFADQTFNWTPSFDQAGTYEVTFTVSDSQAQDSVTVNIKVNNINQPPVFNAIYDKTVHANQTLTFTVEAIDPDGDKINYSALDLPTGSTFINQVFNWSPSQDDIGSYQITFIASDGQDQDTETITITVLDSDINPPSANAFSPDVGEIQVPINSLVTLHVTDNGTGVDANSVTIRLNDDVIYTGNTQQYEGTYGICQRTGTNSDYLFTYQTNEVFDFDKEVKITVNAEDLASNVMNEYTYSFVTEMRSFGENKKVSSLRTDLIEDISVTMSDSLGNIWVAWQAGITGSRNIYVSVLAAETEEFTETISLTNNDYDQCNPEMVIGTDDTIYVVWQDNTRGNWDICVATSLDGQNWSEVMRVTDSNDNEVNPAIAIDKGSPNRAYIAWQDGRNGNQDIYMASSSNGFITATLSKITTNSADQLEPDIAINSDNIIAIVWTDMRNNSSDIYGAASNSSAWTNVPIVNNIYNQSSPAIAAEPTGSTLHLLWVDDTQGHKDIYYSAADGLPDTPLVGTNIVDDTSSADQLTPAIISTTNDLFGIKVFACWQDQRHVIDDSTDMDIYFAELSSTSAGTNILVGDEGTNSDQSNPAIGADEYGHPYIIWADNRNGEEAIYYAGSTFIDPTPLEAENVIASVGATVGVDPTSINEVDDVSVTIPAQACATDVIISISRIKNPPEFSMQCPCIYDFSPSGIEFNYPVTVTIPYDPQAGRSASAYWYNSLTGALSKQGITDIDSIAISPNLHALSFKTTHFTLFYLVLGDDDDGDDPISGDTTSGGSGGGGGCSINDTTGYIGISEFALPYVGLSIVMSILRLRDLRKRKTRNTCQDQP
jgi:hypothetical protein